jgi:hypothetical protein
MKTYNHMLDVAFTVEGPWENYEEIPYEVLVDSLQRRVDYLRRRGPEEFDAFGFCDAYEVTSNTL